MSVCMIIIASWLMLPSMCRCKKTWLTKGYSDKIKLDQQSRYLSEGLKAALYGVHERDGNVVTEPSKVDLDFLSSKYSKPSDNII